MLPFKSTQKIFLTEYVDVLAPLESATDLFQDENSFYYNELILYLLIVKKKLANLNAKEVKYCGSPHQSYLLRFSKRFKTFLNFQKKQIVYMVIIARVTHQCQIKIGHNQIKMESELTFLPHTHILSTSLSRTFGMFNKIFLLLPKQSN